jgi:arylsulfatase A-like enzyme
MKNTSRRDFLKVAGLGLATLAAPKVLAAGSRKPNVIVILADDLGYADVGFNGCKDIATPNIDALAKNGVRCSNGYVSHPFCSPTRAGLQTGRYQQRFGHENNPTWLPEDTKVGLPLSETFLAKQLRAAGYATGAIGKWHLGAAPCFHPNERGYLEYFGFRGGGHMYLPDEKNPLPQEKTWQVEYRIPLNRNKAAVEHVGYMTDILSDEAVAFVGRHKAEPFFLYLAYNAVHTPLQAPEKYLARFPNIADEKRRTYAAMNSAMDDGIGRVVAALHEHGLEKDTLIFFLSDNGGPITVVPCSNAPLRGGKGQVLEGGIRVPFVAAWPGTLPAGAVYNEPVISLDLLPTALALAGAPPPEKPLDGVNLIPHLTGANKAAPHERLFWRTGGGATWAVREGRYKLASVAKAERPQLYDLESDIGEARDLAAEKPDVVKRLAAAFEAWNAQLVAPIFESPRPGQKKNQKGKKK